MKADISPAQSIHLLEATVSKPCMLPVGVFNIVVCSSGLSVLTFSGLMKASSFLKSEAGSSIKACTASSGKGLRDRGFEGFKSVSALISSVMIGAGSDVWRVINSGTGSSSTSISSIEETIGALSLVFSGRALIASSTSISSGSILVIFFKIFDT